MERLSKTYCIFLLLAACLMAMFTACGDSNRRSVERLVTQWQGRQVLFPDVMTDCLTGDTISIADNDFTIITYVDSAGCTGCKMKLPYWDKFMARVDSASTRNVGYLLIVSSSRGGYLKDLIHKAEFPYPVVFDPADSVNALNGFPDDMMFQSFLLDAAHRVVAIGNPVYNPNVADVYLSVLTGRRLQDPQSGVMLLIDETSHDFGTIGTGTPVQHRFAITNAGEGELQIRDIVTSCECTKAMATPSIIPSGGTGYVDVTFREDSVAGDFSRTISVFYNGTTAYTDLEITGTVIATD